MIVRRLSQYSGQINEMDIPITPQQLVILENSDKPVQQVVPGLTLEQYGFLNTGMTPEEWKMAETVWDNQ